MSTRTDSRTAPAAGGDGIVSHAAGMAAGSGAYVLFGLLALYWPLLEPAGALEILAHRIVWSLLFVVALLAVTSGRKAFKTLRGNRKALYYLVAAGCLVGANWGFYIWAVNNNHVVEAALGYYINPLFSTLLGTLLLRERLHRAQWAAIAIAGSGVLWLAIAAGSPPWIALALAGTFGCYGLAKKQANVPAMESLAVETATLVLPAAAFLVFLSAQGTGHFGADTGHSLLLASSGLATAVPLLLFGFAATRIPLTAVGMLQFLTPTIQFLIGVFGMHETVGAAGLGPYVLVWIAVAVYVVCDVRIRRRASAG